MGAKWKAATAIILFGIDVYKRQALEPANCGFDGRAGRTRLLAPFEKHINEIRFCIAEGSREIEALEEECRNLISEQDYGTDGGISCMM